jgi:phage terminase large subunit-like protein
MEAWRVELEAVLKEIPGYDPWDQARGTGCWLDHEAALAAINWFAEYLKHVEGSAKGQPFILRRWQAAIVGNLFGWKRKDEDGRVVRRYRKALIYVARGNGKTPLSAGIVLYAFYEDGEPGAQCYLAAGQKEQAGFLFRNAVGMVNLEPRLLEKVTPYESPAFRSIVMKDDKLAFMKVIPAEAKGMHGAIPHITAIDELHVQDTRELVDVFETAMSKKTRRQPLLVMITTADYDQPSICNEVHQYASNVRDNGGDPEKPGFDPHFLPVIHELRPDDEWTDETLWHKANPNLDVSVSREQLRNIIRKAKETPGQENEIKRLHLNMVTSSDKTALRMTGEGSWDACRRDFTLENLRGRVCYGGLDMASRGDLASFGLVFPPHTDEEYRTDLWRTLSWSWSSREKVKWRETRKIPYGVWEKNGWLSVSDGDRIDHKAIAAKIVELRDVAGFDIRQIMSDPREATVTMQDLQDTHGFEVVEVPQTMFNMSIATKELLARVDAGQLAHNGNPVLRWAASNLCLHYKGKVPQGESLLDFLDKCPAMPSKQSSRDKIDPITALVLAMLGILGNPSSAGSGDGEVMTVI